MDMRPVGKAATLAILIGALFVIITTITSFLPYAIEDPSMADILRTMDTAMTYLSLIFFFGLYAFVALRAVRRFGLDVMGAGMVSAMSYAIVGLFHLLINMVIQLLLVNKVISLGSFRTAESALAASLIGSISPDSAGVLISSLCGLGIVAVGFLVNFIVGAMAGMISRGKGA